MEQLINTTDSADGKEGDAGEAEPAGMGSPRYATMEDLRSGPPPGWHRGRIALTASGVKAETIGLESGYERHASPEKIEEDPEGHIIRGQE